ncbi:MAG: DUF5615 family PIN-like protein [Rhodopila sp.]
MKILLDQNLSVRLGRLLTGHDVTHASSVGWAELTNGVLLNAGEAAGFEIFLTGDKNIQHQTNMAGRRIAIVVLETNQLNILFANVDLIMRGIGAAISGGFVTVTFDRPALRRRPFPPGVEC